ncbi:hypothetical protein HTG_17245 [Natrinema mahii]|nr:hypothetical protein HTG_17245 [Natrinema mahii]
MSRKSRHKRRSVLKKAGLAVASVVGIGASQSAAARPSEEPDTSFDPKDQRETSEFVRALYEVDDADPYLHSLSQRQEEAVSNIVTDITLVTTVEPSTSKTRDVSPQATWQSETVRIKEEGTTPVGSVEFVFYQELSWDYNTEEYKNVNQEPDYELPGIAASWNGVSHESITEQAEHFIAELHGEFALDLFGAEPSTGEAEITTQGDRDGDHEIIDRNNHV